MSVNKKPSLSFSEFLVYRCPANSFSNNNISNEAVYLASPALLAQHVKNADDEKISISLKKYQQRASTRCTPFGLFAGCGIGKWGNENFIKKQIGYRHTRLDMNVVCEIASFLISHPAIKKHLTYRTNNSIYKVADKYRYVEYDLKNKQRSYKITSIDIPTYINDIVVLTNETASYFDLVNCLLQHNVTNEEAEQFIEELVQSQIITTNLYPNVTGVDFYTVILNTVKEIAKKNNLKEVNEIYHILIDIDNSIKNIDAGFDNQLIVYKSIYEKLKNLLPQLTEDNLFQADLYYGGEGATIHKDVQIQLTETISFLDKLYNEKEPTNLKKFKENFARRYEEEELPLAQVLDTVSGIGYYAKDNNGINHLVDDIFYADSPADSVNIKWSAAESLLLNKLLFAQANNLSFVEFSDEDVKNETRTSNIPPSVSVFFSVISNKQNALNFKYAGGSSAGNLLGRFALGNSDINGLVNEITQHEKQFYADKIMAEILHLPEDRIGNILLRPHTHKYEIPFLAKSTKPKNEIIEISDLLISVKNNRVILRSKNYGKEIIPRLTTAHNYNLSTLPIYLLLCDLQTQYCDKAHFSFYWGQLANEFDFLPRATYKNTTLHPAQWNIKKEKLITLVDSLKQYNQSEIEGWQNSLKLPKKFLLVDGDNELYVNINDELSVKAFASTIKKRDKIILHEFLFNETDSLISDEKNGSYANELIAVLYNHEKHTGSPLQINPISNIKRSFIIGSEWLYYKIYCNPKIAERILINTIYPLIQKIQEDNVIEKWFFIRYNDPEHHVRLRFKVVDISGLSIIQTQLFNLLDPLIENKLIEKIQTDTYNRELERYGFENIEDTETLFYIDSVATLNLIKELDNDDEGDLVRFKYACLSAYQLVQDFKLDSSNIDLIISLAQQNYFKEFGGHKNLKIILDKKYRKLNKLVGKITDYKKNENPTEENLYITSIISKKEVGQNEIIASVLQKQKLGNLTIDLNDYIQSLIHMQINRLFQGKHRIYELLVYDFLQRSLKSEKAIKSKDTIIKP